MDELLDILHGHGSCGCAQCAYASIQWGVNRNGKHWVSAVLPGENRVEYFGDSLDQAAQRLIVSELERDPVEA